MSRKRSRNDAVAPVELNSEYTCAICADLVVDARVVKCCTQIFCYNCITAWLQKGPNEMNSCPGCRVLINKNDLFPDLRADRKSADHPRNCPFYAEFGCSFIGNRREVEAHKMVCDDNPNHCCKALCVQLKARKDQLEISCAQLTVERAKQAKEIDFLRRDVNKQRKELIAANQQTKKLTVALKSTIHQICDLLGNASERTKLIGAQLLAQADIPIGILLSTGVITTLLTLLIRSEVDSALTQCLIQALDFHAKRLQRRNGPPCTPMWML